MVSLSAKHLVTISGVHGVGKTSLLMHAQKRLGGISLIDRPKNPFQTPFEAMLFFVASFSQRDRLINQQSGLTWCDRWAMHDIAVYAWTLFELGHLSRLEAEAIVRALRRSESFGVRPDVAILIDDEPEAILSRIEQYRKPSPHHIFERDKEFISALRIHFLARFRDLVSKKKQRIFIVAVNNRPACDVAEEAILEVRRLLYNKDRHE